jgi:hypothetical protein
MLLLLHIPHLPTHEDVWERSSTMFVKTPSLDDIGKRAASGERPSCYPQEAMTCRPDGIREARSTRSVLDRDSSTPASHGFSGKTIQMAGLFLNTCATVVGVFDYVHST